MKNGHCRPQTPALKKAGLMSVAVVSSFMLMPLAAKEPSGPAPRPPEIALPASVKEITAEELDAALKEERFAVIIDVRSPDETKRTGSLPKAVYLDYFSSTFIDAAANLKVDKSKPCLVYCALGGRSRRAATSLTSQGYTNLVTLKGGYQAWTRHQKDAALK